MWWIFSSLLPNSVLISYFLKKKNNVCFTIQSKQSSGMLWVSISHLSSADESQWLPWSHQCHTLMTAVFTVGRFSNLCPWILFAFCKAVASVWCAKGSSKGKGALSTSIRSMLLDSMFWAFSVPLSWQQEPGPTLGPFCQWGELFPFCLLNPALSSALYMLFQAGGDIKYVFMFSGLQAQEAEKWHFWVKIFGMAQC